MSSCALRWFGNTDIVTLPQYPRRRDIFTKETVLARCAEAQAAEKEVSIPRMSMLDLILNALENDKAEDIVTLDLAGKSSVADYMVVASGRSTRQVISIAEKLSTRLRQDMGIVTRTEGKDVGDWVLIDAGDVIVHVFRPEVREFYQLEKMWQQVPVQKS